MADRLNGSNVASLLFGKVAAAFGEVSKVYGRMAATRHSQIHGSLSALMRKAGLSTKPLPAWDASLAALKLERTRQDERARLARDLHDQTGQQVSLLKLNLRALQSEIHSAAGITKLSQINRLVDTLAEDIHRVVVGLHPPGLDQFGLVPVLETLAEEWSASTGIAVTLQIVGHGSPENPDVNLALYRIAQESLTNISKHALTSCSVSARLHCTRDLIILTVENEVPNTKGDLVLEPSATSKASRCGINGMRERMFALGGRLDVASGPNGGLRVSAQIPLRR